MVGSTTLRERLRDEIRKKEVEDYLLQNIEEGNEVVLSRDSGGGLKVKSLAVKTLKIKK